MAKRDTFEKLAEKFNNEFIQNGTITPAMVDSLVEKAKAGNAEAKKLLRRLQDKQLVKMEGGTAVPGILEDLPTAPKPAGKPAAKKAVDPAELAAADKAAQERAAKEAAARAEEARKAREAAEKAKAEAAKPDAQEKARAEFEAAKAKADKAKAEAERAATLAKRKTEQEVAQKSLEEARKTKAKEAATGAKVPKPKVDPKPKRNVTKPAPAAAVATPALESAGLPELRAKTPQEIAAEVDTPGRRGSFAGTSVEANKAVTELRARNLANEWSSMPAKKKTDLLKRAFGTSAFPDAAIRDKAGQLALASEALQKAGFGGDKNLLDFDIKEKLRSLKGNPRIGEMVENLHGRVVTKGGRVKDSVFGAGRVKAGEVAGAKPRQKPLEPRPASPGFETARTAEVPASARTTIKTGTIGPGGELPELTPRGAAPAAPAPAAAAAEAAPTAAGAAAAATEAAEELADDGLTAFQRAVNADPEKYGTGFGKGKVKATSEQYKARRALAESLKSPADKAYGAALSEAYKSNPTKYGKSPRTANAAQKKARAELRAKLRPQYFPDEAKGAAKGAAKTVGAGAGPKKPPAPAGTTAPAPTPTPTPTPTPAPTTPPTGTAPAGGGVAEAAKKVGKKGAGLMRMLGPLFAIFGAYEVLSMLRQGTVGAEDERRLKALQALQGVSGGMQQDYANRQAIGQMQSMVDLAGMQRQRALDEMNQQYTGNQALDALLRGQQASLNALAMPSRPSIAEMMARY